MSLPNPTDGELAILRVMWDLGPCTVKDVHRILSQSKDTAYTTVLRMCQIMQEKGLVTRDESERQHVYTPVIAEAQAQTGLLDDLLEKAFRGSASSLVLRALSGAQSDAQELEAIQEALDRLREGRKS